MAVCGVLIKVKRSRKRDTLKLGFNVLECVLATGTATSQCWATQVMGTPPIPGTWPPHSSRVVGAENMELASEFKHPVIFLVDKWT